MRGTGTAGEETLSRRARLSAANGEAMADIVSATKNRV